MGNKIKIDVIQPSSGYIYYDIDTGSMYRVVTHSSFGVLLNSPLIREVVTKDTYGYLVIKINGKTYKQHRIIYWQFFNIASDFSNQINHIDGNKLNNKADNLELNTPQQNTRHRSKMYKNNGLPVGVSIKNGKYVVRQYISGKRVQVTCASLNEANKVLLSLASSIRKIGR